MDAFYFGEFGGMRLVQTADIAIETRQQRLRDSVGPRPLVVEELPRYGQYIDHILTIRPGISGLWQVSGRNNIPYPKRIQIDVYYVNFRTFWTDLWIMVRTIGVVIFPKDSGAY